MHPSALYYGKLFFDTYLGSSHSSELLIVDVGSLDVNGSLRQFAPLGSQYVGVDFVDGKGVDVILTDPYTLPFETASVDAVICSSVYEHSEFFWLLFLELLRILKPTGLLYINAPSNGAMHRYPIDAWRFYPDAGKSLTNWARRNGAHAVLLESFIGSKLGEPTQDGMWNDFVAVFARDENQLPKIKSRMADSSPHVQAAYVIGSELQGAQFELMPDQVLMAAQINDLLHARAEKDNLQKEISAILNSRSWRYTAIIRKAGKLARPPIRIIRRVHQELKFGGGLLNLIKKTCSLAQREGLSGILKKIIESDKNNYKKWIALYDTLDERGRICINEKIEKFYIKSKISVVMPVYNPKPEWLVEAIESVRTQIYPAWELCIADDASTDPAIRPLLERYVRMDDRIKVVFRQKNGHISAASNSALELVTGEWVALLDNDDLLSEQALFWVANSFNEHPDAGLIYSDEDKISETGVRSSPYFKCDWNPDLFYSHNMICHLGVYRTTLVRECEGFRVGLEGAQDYDLALRCIEKLNPTQIIHIPRVLYHWRMHQESTALSNNSKPYAVAAGARAINEHFARTGINGQVEHTGLAYQPTYALPAVPPLVSIIIPTRNGENLLRKCIDSIFEKTTYTNFEVLVIDNGSDDPATLNYLAQLSQAEKINIIRDDGPFNYSRLNNMAVELAAGDVIALLNNDIEVISPDWLSIMISHAQRPGIGAVGAKLRYTNGAIQHGGVILGLGGVAGHSHKHSESGALGYARRLSITQNFSAVTGACLVIQKQIFKDANGLDEENLAVAFNDVDFCMRVKEAGYRNIWTPLAELFHHESATRGGEDTIEKQLRFSKEIQYMKQRWGDKLLNDPAYSPNLTLDFEDFSFAWPPRVERFHSA